MDPATGTCTYKSKIFAIKLPCICKHNSPCRHVKTKGKCLCGKQGLSKNANNNILTNDLDKEKAVKIGEQNFLQIK